MTEILAAERAKIIGMLNDLADLKFFARDAQRQRLEEIEQSLRVALLENYVELRQGGGPAARSEA
jgi:hypothetical protein